MKTSDKEEGADADSDSVDRVNRDLSHGRHRVRLIKCISDQTGFTKNEE